MGIWGPVPIISTFTLSTDLYLMRLPRFFLLKSLRHLYLAALTVLLPVSACTQPIPEGAIASEKHRYRIVTVVEGLDNPWAIAFLPGGDMLVTERPGRLRVVQNGRLVEQPVPGVPEVRAGGQGGLMDVVPHPQFEQNRWVYLSYSKPGTDGQNTTSVIRGKFQNDRLSDVEEVFEAKAWSNGRGHYGSRLAFDRQGYLYITVGDRQVRPQGDLENHPAQRLDSHHGKTLRLHDDGRVPDDNPFVGRNGALPEIWSYGHRNAQGLAIHPETQDVWLNEHGPQGGDELNLVRKAANYGWPVIGYGVNYGVGTAIHESSTREGMEQPVHYWVPSIATSGMMIYTGDKFPQWRGNAFVGGLAGLQLARLTLDGPRVVDEETLVSRMGRIRDVRQGPDGYIYIVFDHAAGSIPSVVRLEPVN